MTSVDPTLEPSGGCRPQACPPEACSPAATTGIGVIESADLFKGATEVRVRHRGDEYRLRITRQGKLILTK